MNQYDTELERRRRAREERRRKEVRQQKLLLGLLLVVIAAVILLAVVLIGFGKRKQESLEPGGGYQQAETNTTGILEDSDRDADENVQIFEDQENGTQGEPLQGQDAQENQGQNGDSQENQETEGQESEQESNGAEASVGGSDQDLLLLVNNTHALPADYQVDVMELSNGQLIDRQIYPALQQMFDDARSQGIYPVVASGYRTAEKQQSLMDEKVAEYVAMGYSQEDAESEAATWVAAVGYSEHQLGLAVDINADGVNSGGDEVYNWLLENAWKYGFIQRYPESKTEITGISYEPWHYRYVGEEAAKEIYEQGVCLEEYVGAA